MNFYTIMSVFPAMKVNRDVVIAYLRELEETNP
jgi:hypothetical protein